MADLIREVDADGDGKISAKESEKSPRAKRQFPRWDRDKDGFATSKEIIAMRRSFGIDADGNRIQRPGTERPAAKLTFPKIEDITRIDPKTRGSAEERAWALGIIRTEAHPVDGEGYVILTDHQEEEWLEPLRRLGEHRNGKILILDDLATIHESEEKWNSVRERIAKEDPRFVAIAPRQESYREKMLVGIFKLLASFDDDPQLDVFPGLLVAPDADSFAKLIAHSIKYEPRPTDEFKAFLQCHFTDHSPDGLRTVQKVGILRDHFSSLGPKATPSLVIRSSKVPEEKPLKGDDIVYATSERRLLTSFPDASREPLAGSPLLVMFGHGSPGMAAGFTVEAFHDVDLTGKIVLSGSCWSAAPTNLDFPMPRRDAAGTDLEDDKERFLMRAVENGAVVSFGHMRLCGGFRALYPVLESWTEGLTVGEAYQRLANALLAMERTPLDTFLALDPEKLPKSGRQQRSPAIPGNQLLYVILGDPALQPFEALGKKGE